MLTMDKKYCIFFFLGTYNILFNSGASQEVNNFCCSYSAHCNLYSGICKNGGSNISLWFSCDNIAVRNAIQAISHSFHWPPCTMQCNTIQYNAIYNILQCNFTELHWKIWHSAIQATSHSCHWPPWLAHYSARTSNHNTKNAIQSS